MTTSREEILLQPEMIEKLERLGYTLLPRTHRNSPGFTGILLLLRAQPHPEALADPESLHLRLQNADGSVHWTTIDAQTDYGHSRTVCPGPVQIRAHDGTETAFFTFGGTLAGKPVATGGVYALHSPAPILCLTSGEPTVGSHLADEVEAILAQQHAQAGLDDATFLRRLATMRPRRLYVTLLAAVLDHYRQVPALKRSHLDFYLALVREKKWLESTEQWPAPAGALADYL